MNLLKIVMNLLFMKKIATAISTNFLAVLKKGMPLPNLNEVQLTNPGVLVLPVTSYILCLFLSFLF